MPDPTTTRQPGRLVRALGKVHRGVAAAGLQIPERAEEWHAVAATAERGDLPLWVALGDSLTQGIGSSSRTTSWVGTVAERLAAAGDPHGVINLAVSGARARDVLDEQLPQIERLSRQPAIVTLTVGSNDLLRSVRLGRTRATLRDVLRALPRGSIVATLPASGSLAASQCNKMLRHEIVAAGHHVADVDAHLSGWRGRTSGDGFHPNDAGYQAWVSAFSEALLTCRTAAP